MVASVLDIAPSTTRISFVLVTATCSSRLTECLVRSEAYFAWVDNVLEPLVCTVCDGRVHDEH
jgi:hypothetical protein